MLKLKRRKGSPYWQISGTIQGRSVRESTGTGSRPHAEALLAKRQAELLDQAVFGERRTAIFAEAVEHYLRLGGEARFLSPLLERFGTWKIAEITQAEVARAAHDLYPGRSAAYHIRAVYTPLGATLRAAHKAGLCDLVVFEKPKVKKVPVVYAQDEWFQAVLPHCSTRLVGMILFLAMTGARVTEACNLRPGDVGLDAMKAVLLQTKNGSTQIVALPRPLVEVMREVWANYTGDPVNGRFFGFASRHSVNQAIERACDRVNERAGCIRFEVTGRNAKGRAVYRKVQLKPNVIPYLSSHKIGRHAFAARLLAEGRSIKFVQEAGRWKTMRMVGDTYGHLERSHIEAALHDSGTNFAHTVVPARKRLGVSEA